jgi:hypothetical protein
VVAWRGIGGDQRIWYTAAQVESSVDQPTGPLQWSAQKIVDGGGVTDLSPSLAVVRNGSGGLIYLAWKGAGSDTSVHHATLSSRAQPWQVLGTVPGVSTVRSPTLTAGLSDPVTLFQATAMATSGNSGVFTIAVLGQAVLLAAVARQVKSVGTLIAAAAFASVGLAFALARPLPPELLINAPLQQLDLSTLRSAVTVAVLLTLAVVVGAAAVVRMEVGSPGIWWPLGFVGLYGFSGIVLCATMLVAPDQQGFLIGQVLVTVGWTGCALLLLVRGIEAVLARMAGLALVAGALIKLIMFDLSTLDGIDRVAAFLGSGLVLLAAGVRYARAVTARRGATDQD